MKKPSPLVPLALLSAAFALTPHAHAEDFLMRRRGAVQYEAGLLGKFDEGAERVKVVILAKEARGVGLLHDDPIERRRQVASASTSAIRDLLRSPKASVSSAGGAPEAPTEITYLWAANAVAAEVSRDQLEKLAATGTVRKVILDRDLTWLDAKALEGGKKAPKPASPVNYGLEKVRAEEAWQEFGVKGEGVRVGHIDTGVDPNHPALAGKVIAFKDFINGRSDSYDDQGHGTHSAGSIVADGVGVAPGAKLIVAKSLNQFGSGSFSQLMDAMQWMLDPDGDPSTDDQPHLVSNSWGADRNAVGDEESIFRDVVKAWREAGIVPVFASGNSGHGTEAIPGGYPEAFAVGATDQNDEIAQFSTGGPTQWDGVTITKPDVSAPGVAILSTMPGGDYAPMNGTSMACPHVAGAVALILSKNPDLTVDQVEEALKSTSKDLGQPGRDERYGEGRIDVLKAMQTLAGQKMVASIQAFGF